MDRLLRTALMVMLMWVFGTPMRLAAQPLSGGVSGPLSSETPEKIMSQVAARQFLNMAEGMAFDPNLSERDADIAVLLLEGAQELKQSELSLLPVLLDVVTRFPPRQNSDLVLQSLRDARSEPHPVGLIRVALRYLLAGYPSAVERQRFLETMVNEWGGTSDELDSEFAFLLGLLAEQSGHAVEAQTYFHKAYRLDPSNHAAFTKLSEMIPDKISASMFLSHLRFGIQAAPLNLDNALAFAQYAERLELYAVAAGSYAYCAELFSYLYPEELLPPHIYLSWAMSVYNDGQKLAQVMEIAQRVRQGDRFDIFIEAIVGKAADKAGRREEGNQIFAQTVEMGERLMGEGTWQQDGSVHQVGPKQLAWFYSFALKDRAKALDWANRAYADDPNSPVSMSLLAYSLVMEDQIEYARPLLDQAGSSQIAELARAQIEFKKQQREPAVKALKQAIAKDPGSLVAEEAKRLMAQESVTYRSPIVASELLKDLTRAFGPRVLPEFRAPEKAFTFEAKAQAQAMAYTQDLEVQLSVVNHLDRSLKIGLGSMIEGWIRIDASVRGDAQRDFPRLVYKRLFVDQWLPASGLATGVINLSYSELGQWLARRPQADLDITLTITLDPVDKKGSVRCRLARLEPILLSVKRPKVSISPQWLQNQYNAIATGTEGQKIAIAKWFSGLLKEQQIVQDRGEAPYPLKSAPWLARHLKVGLAGDDNLVLDAGRDAWPVRVCSMACLAGLRSDEQLTDALSKNLRHPYWPVRFMAILILAQSQGRGFDPVLEWTSTYDRHARVRMLASLLHSK